MNSKSALADSAPMIPADSWQPSWKERANDFATRLLGRIGGTLSQVFGNHAPDTFGILMYHRIAPHVRGVPHPPYNVTPERFREQITGLVLRGFRFVPLSAALACHARGIALPPQTVVLTFDDCFESVYTHAWPVMRDHKIPATLFLSTAYLDSNAPFPFDTWGFDFADRVPADHYRPIRTEQCLEMAASGLVQLGTHTHTHADFRKHVAAFTREMRLSAEILDERFGVARPQFSLPFGCPRAGYASQELLDAARDSGAHCALTTAPKLVHVEYDPFGWGRINVFASDNSIKLAGKLTGWYEWAPRAKERMRRVLKPLVGATNFCASFDWSGFHG